jgi:hypothetical protein
MVFNGSFPNIDVKKKKWTCMTGQPHKEIKIRPREEKKNTA